MNEPIRPEDMRASDADRNLVQDRLRRAHELGQLDLHEFDERVGTAWAARTRGELAAVVADLPVPAPPPPTPRHGAVFARTAGGIAMQVLTIIWVTITVANLVIWGILELTVGPGHLSVVAVGRRAAGRGAGGALRVRHRTPAPHLLTGHGARCCTNQSRAGPQESSKPFT